MNNFVLYGLLLVIVGTDATAQSKADLSFLSCPDNSGEAPSSRSLISSTPESATHWRAYVTVSALGSHGSCHNTTTLYVASPKGPFKRVFKQNPLGTQDGNGARIVGWSPAGNKLLVEITDWAYGSDAQLGRTVLIYEPAKPVQKPEIDRTLIQKFGKNCLFAYSPVGWSSESVILLQLRPFREELDERRSCVSKTTDFTFDIGTQSLRLVGVRR